MQDFLPINRKDLQKCGWPQPDFILITGDAYVDHPSFGAAIISRVLENHGYKVGILSQPDWHSAKSFRRLGEPRLAFLITSGNIDSMVNNYTAANKKRCDDVYSPGGRGGLRPDRAVISYSIRVREAFGKIPVILGGLEASLRRLAHYDYWTNKVRPSVLTDAHADLLIYGMGELAMLAVAKKLAAGISIDQIRSVPGTVIKLSTLENIDDYIMLPPFDSLKSDKKIFADSFIIQYLNNNHITGKRLVEAYKQGFVIQNPPARPLTQAELDQIHELKYTRNYHPVYKPAGGVPALKEVKFSLQGVRGCFGNCHFCSLTFHQGRAITARSHESLIREAKKLVKYPDFKGYIHDVGGPTANFRKPACARHVKRGNCQDRECLVPKPCKNLIIDHNDFLTLLTKLKNIQGIKKVFIRSGLRFDYILADPDESFFRALIKDHISGQLKVAPEYLSDKVLQLMNKPSHTVYKQFKKYFNALNKKYNKKQYLLPYYISGHPGSTLETAIELALHFHENHFIPEQVQDFYPTPGTVSTCMYYTGINPRTGQKVYVPKNRYEKAMHRSLLQFNQPKNYQLVYNALLKAGRKDLIGYGRKCLIKPK